MPVPSLLSDLSTTAGSNSPTGSESPTGTDDYLRQHAAFIAMLRDGGGNPAGSLLPYAGTTAPTGYLLCNGAAVSRITYAALYAVIGTTYGVGDGATTFNVPNSVDRVLLGAGNLYANGATGGSKDAVVVSHDHGALTGNNNADHTHTGTTSADGVHTHTMFGGNVGRVLLPGVAGGGTYAPGTATTGDYTSTSADGNHTHTMTTGGVSAPHAHAIPAAGVSGTNANLPPYLGVRFIIKH